MNNIECTEDLERLIIQAYNGDKEAEQQLNEIMPIIKGGNYNNTTKES